MMRGTWLVTAFVLIGLAVLGGLAWSSPGGDWFVKAKETDRVVFGTAHVSCAHIYGADSDLCVMNVSASNISVSWIRSYYYNKTEVDATAAFLLNYTEVTAALLANQTLTIADQLNETYGGMWNFTDAGWTLGIPSSGTYYNVSNLTSGILNKMTFTNAAPSAGGSYLTIGRGGVYHISATVSLKGGNAGEYGIGVVRNFRHPETSNDPPNCYSRFTGSTKYETVAVICYKRIETGDTISMVMDDENAPAQDLTIMNVNVNVIWVGNL